VLPDVPYVPYVLYVPPSLNPSPHLSMKAAISDDFPTDVAPYSDQYKPHPTDHLPGWPTNANDRWNPVTGNAWPYCQRCIELLWHNSTPFVPEEYDEEYYDEDFEEREDTPTKQL